MRISPSETRQRDRRPPYGVSMAGKGTRHLIVEPSALIVEYSLYSNYETLKEDFIVAVSSFFEHYPDSVASRLGLRYVNNITDVEGDLFSWEKYLDDRMLCPFSFFLDKGPLVRVFHNVELNFGDCSLRYQFGMHNPDYPAPIKKKHFILDLDAYSQSPNSMSTLLPTSNPSPTHPILVRGEHKGRIKGDSQCLTTISRFLTSTLWGLRQRRHASHLLPAAPTPFQASILICNFTESVSQRGTSREPGLSMIKTCDGLQRISQGDLFADIDYVEYVIEDLGVIEVSTIVFPPRVGAHSRLRFGARPHRPRLDPTIPNTG